MSDLRHAADKEPQPWSWAEWLVLGILGGLIAVRYFTERLPILPRAANAVDVLAVPVLVLCAGLWIALEARGRIDGGRLLVALWIFCASWLASWLLNSARVHWLGALLFLFGIANPLLLYAALRNLGLGHRFIFRALRLLWILLGVNLVIGSIDALRGRGAATADFVFGTFGVNPNQMAFFLAVMMGFLLARLRFLKFRIAEALMLAWAMIIFLLCGFQTLWLMFTLAAAFVLLIVARLSTRSVILAGLVATVLAVLLPRLGDRFFSVRDTVVLGRALFPELGKVELARNIPRVLATDGWTPWFGLGPGTFNSRAFRSIAIVPSNAEDRFTDVAAAVVAPFYRSDVADRYIIPYFDRANFLLSGANTDAPFTSYVSLPLEVGFFGAVAIFGWYGLTLVGLVRSVRRSADPHEQFLAAWALTAVLMLLGISLVDNFLEATRYTILVWTVVSMWKLYTKGQTRTAQPPNRSVRVGRAL
jgi:hypothetical protein